MLATVDVPFADARAGQLTWSVNPGVLAVRPALAHLVVRVCLGPVAAAAATIDLRVLGSSHQVVLSVDDGRRLTETVACDAGESGLPESATRDLYSFSSSVEALGGDEFAARVDELTATHAPRDASLVGWFPGPAAAVTILAAADSGVGWTTWHAYPQTRELVTTRTVVKVRS